MGGPGVRPVRIVSGSHFRTVVFGAISIDGTQLFRQYETFDGPSFLDFLKKLHRKFGGSTSSSTRRTSTSRPRS